MTLPRFFGKPKKPSAPFMIRRVSGTSMLPTLRPDAVVWGWRWFRRTRIGDVVIIRHQGMDKVKRIMALNAHNVFVAGDNAARSTDSRNFGWIGKDTIQAKVWVRRRLRATRRAPNPGGQI